ncbi:tetratricopeptide repeat protein [Sphingomonas sanxanigenens]|uniref:Uncharacterized protein n=1 Tax=Sphingomonas sanxanigenens DSM 19645 = NX02 TaxID=1123269 RepID=W0AJP3_9SPHN|nr:tetratricopeptide repeat protein [Sphingomonas sanxanigenens]AHE56483.1 hypothetical protein NX02_24380 [Sphingomonas sanxanigenens DSM 19645 = NX02]
MILFPLLLLAQAAAPAEDAPLPSLSARENAERFERCADLAIDEPQRAIDEASAWRMSGGSFAARQCLGLAYAQLERWVPAATAFEQAAHEAEVARDGAAANLWLQAGNAQLAAGNAEKAQSAFSAALGTGALQGLSRGEAHLDRARAMVALGNTAGARTDIDRALEFAPADPLAWLLSATLARRMNDLPRAQKDIGEAVKRAPDDASVAYEAGVIALKSGAEDAARAAWKGAIAAQPGSPAAKASEQALTQLDGGVAQPVAAKPVQPAAAKPAPSGR